MIYYTKSEKHFNLIIIERSENLSESGNWFFFRKPITILNFKIGYKIYILVKDSHYPHNVTKKNKVLKCVSKPLN